MALRKAGFSREPSDWVEVVIALVMRTHAAVERSKPFRKSEAVAFVPEYPPLKWIQGYSGATAIEGRIRAQSVLTTAKHSASQQQSERLDGLVQSRLFA
ncbi:hypothetical protein ABID47_002579 [Paenibacillus favisporus]|uniref:Uncharacterized protein n=1 Tax=Paenibacillus favisporus TaxID=221028 RepID=A0ABV2F2H5_9BACL